MPIEFVDSLPKKAGVLQIDLAFCTELIDALLDNPNTFAKVPYTDFYPQHKDVPESKLKGRARNLTSRIREGQRPFDEYVFEARTVGTDIYIRLLMDEKEIDNGW